MTSKEVFVRNIIVAGITLVVSASIFALLGNLLLSDRAYAALVPDMNRVSLFDKVNSLIRFAKSSSLQLIIATVTSFSLYAVPVSVSLMMYRGASLGLAFSILLKGAYRSQTGEVAGIEAMWPVLVLYFISSVIILFLTSRLNSLYRKPVAFAKSSHAVFNAASLFLLCSGAVFALDMIRILFL